MAEIDSREGGVSWPWPGVQQRNETERILMNHTPLYDGRTLRVTPIDVEKDAPVIAEWSYAPRIVSQIREESANPLTIFEAGKILGNWKHASEDGGHTFFFALRPKQEERLVGFLRLIHIQWVHGAGLFSLVIGNMQDWDVFAREALDLALNYAFDELNLFRVTARIAEDDHLALELFRQAQFYLEVRQRQAIFRDGRYLDRLSFGMLRPEWEAFRVQEVA
jgi:RimJ/RimL family protein N-acetyltransferase